MVKAVADKSDQQAHQHAVVMGGLKAGSLGLGAGAAGIVAGQRFVPAVRSMTVPLKAFAVVSAILASFIIGADHSSRQFELAKYKVGSGTALERESRQGINAERQAGLLSSSGGAGDHSSMSTKDVLVEWGKEHRYATVFGAWAASMAGSFGYISMTPLSFAQKLVQARMVAQGLTVVVLIASAGLSAIPNSAGVNEEQVKRDLREEQMFKWKSGSPHEKEHQHASASASANAGAGAGASAGSK